MEKVTSLVKEVDLISHKISLLALVIILTKHSNSKRLVNIRPIDMNRYVIYMPDLQCGGSGIYDKRDCTFTLVNPRWTFLIEAEGVAAIKRTELQNNCPIFLGR